MAWNKSYCTTIPFEGIFLHQPLDPYLYKDSNTANERARYGGAGQGVSLDYLYSLSCREMEPQMETTFIGQSM